MHLQKISKVEHRQASAPVKGMLTSRARAAFANSQGPFQKVFESWKVITLRIMFKWIRVNIKF